MTALHMAQKEVTYTGEQGQRALMDREQRDSREEVTWQMQNGTFEKY